MLSSEAVGVEVENERGSEEEEEEGRREEEERSCRPTTKGRAIREMEEGKDIPRCLSVRRWSCLGVWWVLRSEKRGGKEVRKLSSRSFVRKADLPLSSFLLNHIGHFLNAFFLRMNPLLFQVERTKKS